MVLDLRRGGGLSIEHAKEITALEPEVREEYNDYISQLIQINNISGLSWLLRVTCRNTYLSLIHDRFCRIRLLENLLKRGESVSKVLVDSESLKVVCERVLDKYACHVVVECEVQQAGNKMFQIILNLFKSLYFLFVSFLIPKLFSGKKLPGGSIIYLDSFLFIDSLDGSGELKDRYYPGLLENLDDDGIKEKIWYVPTLIGIKSPGEYIALFKSIRSSSSHFLMKEDWLTLGDYFKALFYSLSLPRLVRSVPTWNGLDINEIVEDEVAPERGSPSLFNAVLMYMFIRRLKKKGVGIELMIDWHENQVIDRAVILAMRKYYPDVIIKGYQGYVIPDYYAGKDPTSIENEMGTLPDEICVVGRAFLENKKKYCSSLNVSVAPAFRFSNIHNSTYSVSTKSNEILVVLPISLEESRAIIAICMKLVAMIGNQYKFIIKQHPSFTKERFIKLVPDVSNSYFSFSDKPLYEHLCQCRLLVSMSSSVCVEAAVLGVPLAIIGSISGPAMNPLDGVEGVGIWRVCYDENDVVDFLNSDFSNEKSDVNYYFEPVSASTVQGLIMKHVEGSK